MCGIWTFINLLKRKNIDFTKLFQDFWNTKNRGPDNSYFENYGNVWVGFHRLAIMDTSFKSNQPFVFQEKERTVVFVCNGEIYNFRELIDIYKLPITSNSDCMTIPELYLKFTRKGETTNVKDFFNLFDDTIKGEFAFVLLEFDKLKNLKLVISGRDQIGIRPLYYHPVNENSKGMLFSSEIKGTNIFDDEIIEFPPGIIKTFHIDDFDEVLTTDYNFKNV
jgi:asparagine synthase (glutamine-hydrolysing)